MLIYSDYCFIFSFNCLAFGCNFDSSLCGFAQDTSDTFDWTRHRGSTPSHSTGPSADHTTGTGMQNLFLIAFPLSTSICDQPFKKRPVLVYLAEMLQGNIFLTIPVHDGFITFWLNSFELFYGGLVQNQSHRGYPC